MFQDYALFPHLSAWQNVGYGLPRRQRRERALDAARALRARRTAPTRARARSRAASASAWRSRGRSRCEPAALLLDEPLSALDARTRAAAGRELAAVLREAAVPALLVTHDFQEAALLGDRVGVMDGGRIVQIGSASELAAEPASPFVADFTGAVVLTGTASAAAGGLTRVELDGGGEVTSPEPRQRSRRRHRLPVGHRAGARPARSTPARPATTSTWRCSPSPPSATACGSGLAAPQPLTAELTEPAVARLHIEPGARLVASWKATATKLLPL